MKRIFLSIVITVLCVGSVYAQNNNALRSGIGICITGSDIDESSDKLLVHPSLFTEYGHKFSNYFATAVNLHVDMCSFDTEAGGFHGGVSIRGLVKPFYGINLLDRLEIGAGVSGEYRGYFHKISNESFMPGFDFPCRIYILDNGLYELSAFYEIKTVFYKTGDYKWNYSNVGVMFGIKF